jgi:hypothetical protein
MRSSEESSRNAFAPDYLSTLSDRDESPTGIEATMAGPWEIRLVPGFGFGVFRPGGEGDGEPNVPHAILKSYDTAQLVAAVLPMLGRDGAYRLDPTEPIEKRAGFRLEVWEGENRGLEQAGVLRWHEPELVDLLNLADFLARTPASLALLLDAAGESALRPAGQLLWRHLVARPR